jgi:hypothetical protein
VSLALALSLSLGGTQERLLREDIMCYLLVVIEKDPTLYIWEMKLLLEYQFGALLLFNVVSFHFASLSSHRLYVHIHV